MALAETDGTVVSFIDEWPGGIGVTQVRRLNLSDVTGEISSTATVTIVPEPASVLLLTFGAIMFAGHFRRSRRM